MLPEEEKVGTTCSQGLQFEREGPVGLNHLGKTAFDQRLGDTGVEEISYEDI